MGVRGGERAGTIEDEYPYKKNAVMLYNATGGAIAKGQVVTIGFANTALKQAQCIANVTTTFPVKTAVAVKAVANAKFGVFQTGGIIDALVTGTSVIAGDFLEVITGDTAFREDGAARTTVSGAIALAAQAGGGADGGTGVLTSVFLINEQHTIAGT